MSTKKLTTVTQAIRKEIEARVEAGDTLYRIAKDAGITFDIVYRFMADPNRGLSSETIDALAVALNLEPPTTTLNRFGANLRGYVRIAVETGLDAEVLTENDIKDAQLRITLSPDEEGNAHIHVDPTGRLASFVQAVLKGYLLGQRYVVLPVPEKSVWFIVDMDIQNGQFLIKSVRSGMN